MRVAKPVQLNADDEWRLRILSNRKRIEARVQMRARIVLMAAEGISDKDIAEKLDSDRRVAARSRSGRRRGRLIAGREPSGASAHHARASRRARSGSRHAQGDAPRGDSLEHTHYGRAPGK